MTDLRKLCMTLYGVFGLSAVLQFVEATILLGLLALTIAYILTKCKYEAARDTPYASHLRWMLRTFWIGTGVIVPVAVLIATALILMLTNIADVVTAMSGDDPTAIMSSVQAYMTQNLTKISLITAVTMVPTILWWVRRCWIGFALARDEKPVTNVTSWL